MARAVMKKSLKALLLSCVLLPCLAVAGCDNEKTKGNSSPSSSSSSVFTSQWPEDVAKDIQQVLNYDIPFYSTATKYESAVTVDDYGDPLVIIYCTLDSSEAETAEYTYYNLCEQAGYYVEHVQQAYTDWETLTTYYYDVYFADIQISDTLGIEIQFLTSMRGGKDCLGIFAYTYIPVNPNQWPTNVITSVLGFDVPKIEREGLTYSVSIELDENNGAYIYMQISNATLQDERKYTNLLTSLEYGFVSTDYDTEGYLAYDSEYTHWIQYKYGLVGEGILEVLIWPM